MAFLIRKFRFLLILLLACTRSATAETLQLQEQEIKAGLLYNFLKYTDWPKERFASPFITVCLFGGDALDGYLQPMAGRSVNQREIAVRSVLVMDEILPCHLLFVRGSEKKRWAELQPSLAGKSILTVSDFTGFASSGGMIEFGRKNDRISVELNLEAVKGAGLQVQNRMLKLVTVMASTSPEKR